MRHMMESDMTACSLATANIMPCMCMTATTGSQAVHRLPHGPPMWRFRYGGHLEVVIENLKTPPDIWKGYRHVTVKAPRPRERSIQVLLHVGGRHDDDALIRLKPIHLQRRCRVFEPGA